MLNIEINGAMVLAVSFGAGLLIGVGIGRSSKNKKYDKKLGDVTTRLGEVFKEKLDLEEKLEEAQ